MNKKTIKAYLYTPSGTSKQGKIKEIQIEDTLEVYYDLIGCKNIEMYRLDNGLTLVCDGYALVKGGDYCLTKVKGAPGLLKVAGTMIFIGNPDEEGNCLGVEKSISEVLNILEPYSIVKEGGKETLFSTGEEKFYKCSINENKELVLQEIPLQNPEVSSFSELEQRSSIEIINLSDDLVALFFRNKDKELFSIRSNKGSNYSMRGTMYLAGRVEENYSIFGTSLNKEEISKLVAPGQEGVEESYFWRALQWDSKSQKLIEVNTNGTEMATLFEEIGTNKLIFTQITQDLTAVSFDPESIVNDDERENNKILVCNKNEAFELYGDVLFGGNARRKGRAGLSPEDHPRYLDSLEMTEEEIYSMITLPSDAQKKVAYYWSGGRQEFRLLNIADKNIKTLFKNSPIEEGLMTVTRIDENVTVISFSPEFMTDDKKEDMPEYSLNYSGCRFEFIGDAIILGRVNDDGSLVGPNRTRGEFLNMIELVV